MEWKEKQAHLLVEFTDHTEDLQIFQDSPLQLTAPMVSNQKIKLKKECLHH
jgi:phage integrase family protein